MADETKTVILTQPANKRLALDHAGSLAIYGAKEQAPVRHEVGAQVIHATEPRKPLVHMVCWDSNCRLEMAGRVTVAGDERAPVHVSMTHHFATDHRQTHQIVTTPKDPIDHALQMRTPLEVRFCNPWHCASDYTVDLRMGKRRMLIRITGATVCTPQPCPDQPIPIAIG